jgi:peptidoglycan/LPS O-acetylase OafA/YrhL
LIPLFYYATTFPETSYFRPLNQRFVRRIGVYSFTLYLCHFIILKGLMLHGLAAEGSVLLIALGAVISVAFAAAVYRFVEAPMLPLRRRFAG